MAEEKKTLKKQENTIYGRNHLWFRQAKVTMEELWNEQTNTSTPASIKPKIAEKLAQIREHMIKNNSISKQHLEDLNWIVKSLNFKRSLLRVGGYVKK
ncbi:hypothetical protein HY989_04675 [Candidatus Micrarchaeota archaeon]|nr:hypothetical protein [Candidatus Micrarchaeota archaeon]